MTPKEPPVGTELKAAFAKAPAFNDPDPHNDGFRKVGFRLPEEIAWAGDQTAWAVLDFMRAALTRPPVEASEVVERVARKLAMFLFDTWGDAEGVVWAGLSAEQKDKARKAARAALAAIPATVLVEPSEAMIEAGAKVVGEEMNCRSKGDCEICSRVAERIYRAMQSAAPGSSEGEVERLRAEVQRLRNILNEEGLVDPELAALAGKRIDALTISARKGKRNFAAPGSSPQAREGEQS